MSKFWLLAVVIALIITAIVEQCYQRDCFDPIVEHSEIKAHYGYKGSLRAIWKYNNGDAEGHLVPYLDSVFVEEY